MPRKKRRPQAHQQYWIGYCRKSTETEDRQIHSLQDQSTMVSEYYQRLPPQERQHHPLKLLQEAQSAYHPGRPVFQNILHMASRGEVQGVIVVHPNRISRNHSDSGAFVQRLVDRHITSLDTTMGKRYTGDDSNDIFMLTLEGAMSWKDSRDKGDRILQAMRMCAAEGKHMGPVRIGYQISYRPDGTKVLETIPDVAGRVHRLFELAATEMYSLQELVKKSYAMGLRTRSGNKLQKSAMPELLRDPIYKGFVRFDGVITKGVHEPIVTEELWERVQRALQGRGTGVSRPKDLTLRDMFVFGNLLRCPKCRRSLSPYRVRKGPYIYYECKNPDTSCRICVPQRALVEQLPPLLAGAVLGPGELERLRDQLLRLHKTNSAGEGGHRKALNAEYERLQREIGEVFSQRKEAVNFGIQDAVDARLGDLKRERDEVQMKLNLVHENGTSWIDKVIRTFELADLLQEAILYGSRETREMSLRAVASNFSVDGKMLILKLNSPFQECAQKQDRPEWWAGLYDMRADIIETCESLEMAFSVLRQGITG